MGNRCRVKFFLGSLAQLLGRNFLILRDKIELKFYQDMFWDNFMTGWYIDEDTLQPVVQKEASKGSTRC